MNAGNFRLTEEQSEALRLARELQGGAPLGEQVERLLLENAAEELPALRVKLAERAAFYGVNRSVPGYLAEREADLCVTLGEAREAAASLLREAAQEQREVAEQTGPEGACYRFNALDAAGALDGLALAAGACPQEGDTYLFEDGTALGACVTVSPLADAGLLADLFEGLAEGERLDLGERWLEAGGDLGDLPLRDSERELLKGEALLRAERRLAKAQSDMRRSLAESREREGRVRRSLAARSAYAGLLALGANVTPNFRESGAGYEHDSGVTFGPEEAPTCEREGYRGPSGHPSDEEVCDGLGTLITGSGYEACVGCSACEAVEQEEALAHDLEERLRSASGAPFEGDEGHEESGEYLLCFEVKVGASSLGEARDLSLGFQELLASGAEGAGSEALAISAEAPFKAPEHWGAEPPLGRSYGLCIGGAEQAAYVSGSEALLRAEEVERVLRDADFTEPVQVLIWRQGADSQ